MAKTKIQCHLCGEYTKFKDDFAPLICSVCGADLQNPKAETLLLKKITQYSICGAFSESGAAHLTNQRLFIIRTPESYSIANSKGIITVNESPRQPIVYTVNLADVALVDEGEPYLNVHEKDGNWCGLMIRNSIFKKGVREEWWDALIRAAKEAPGSIYGSESLPSTPTQKTVDNKKANKTLLAQLVLTLLLFFSVAPFLMLFPIETSSSTTAYEYLINQYNGALLLLVVVVVIGVALLGVNVYCVGWTFKKVAEKSLSPTRRRYPFMLLILCLGFVFLCGMLAVESYQKIAPNSAISQDLRQIREGRLSEASVYVYRQWRETEPGIRRITVAPAVVGETVPREFFILDSLNFWPGESTLLNDNLSQQGNLEKGMKAYHISYTEKRRLIISIAEAPADSPLARLLTSEEMKAFEAEHAVSEEQERLVAFGAFLLTYNRESARILALGESRNHAEYLLGDSWSVDNHESALVQLERLSGADGQSPAADDLFHTLVKNGHLEPLDAYEMFMYGYDFTGLENVYASSLTQAERDTDRFEQLMEFLGASEEDREEVFELFVLMTVENRVNSGLEAYRDARKMLVESFGYTDEELQSISTLAAWDYGRTAIVARYGIAAGYVEEDEAWTHLKLAADHASGIYSGWREYTAAHILGRALAFGNSSADFRDTLEFLLNHHESPFQRIDFSVM